MKNFCPNFGLNSQTFHYQVFLGEEQPIIPLFFFFVVFSASVSAQNTNYTTLFTSDNFTKTINTALPVGTVAASAGAESGVGSYTIPIALPPGTNGIVPSLAVSYNSMQGSGPMGYGWSIGGLSVISRTAKTIYHNGATKAIDLTSEDRFVLDGARLMTKSGTYGANGAIYGTEMENFATITSFGSIGGDPEYFKVESKEGVVMYFGNTLDSRFSNNTGSETMPLIIR